MLLLLKIINSAASLSLNLFSDFSIHVYVYCLESDHTNDFPRRIAFFHVQRPRWNAVNRSLHTPVLLGKICLFFPFFWHSFLFLFYRKPFKFIFYLFYTRLFLTLFCLLLFFDSNFVLIICRQYNINKQFFWQKYAYFISWKILWEIQLGINKL